MKKVLTLMIAGLLASGCEAADAPANNAQLEKGTALPPPEFDAVPEATALPTDEWMGKWIGPEGLVLDIQPAQSPGRYALSVTLLDGTESYEGAASGDTIRFTRGGVEEAIRAARGDDTGLKYLAGKPDCLMIKPGEGFCRE